MSIRLNLGVSKKIGLENYGSAGSSCNVELELDSSSLDHPEEFQRKVREAYAACRSAVEEELKNHRANGEPKQDVRPTPPPSMEYRNSAPPERTENPYPVSPKQLNFIAQLTKSVRGLTAQKLDAYCQVTYGRTCNELSARDASRLIDDLKAAKSGGKEIA